MFKFPYRIIALLLIPCLLADPTTALALRSEPLVYTADHPAEDPGCFGESALAAHAIPYLRDVYNRSLFSRWILQFRQHIWGEDSKQSLSVVISKWVGVFLVASLTYYALINPWLEKHPEWLLPMLIPLGTLEFWVSWRIEQRIEGHESNAHEIDHSLNLSLHNVAAYILYVSLIEGALYEWFLPGVSSVWLRAAIDVVFLSPWIMDPLAALLLHRLAGRNQEQAMKEVQKRLPFFNVFISPVWFLISLAVNSIPYPLLSYIVLSLGVVAWTTLFAFANRGNLYRRTSNSSNWLFRNWSLLAKKASRPIEIVFKNRFLKLNFSLYLLGMGAGLPTAIAAGQAWWFFGPNPWIIGLVSGIVLSLVIWWLTDNHNPPSKDGPSAGKRSTGVPHAIIFYLRSA